MKSKPGMPMSHFIYTDSKVNRQYGKWTKSEEQKFNDAVREVGNNAIQICSIVGSKTYGQVNGHIKVIRNLFKRDPNNPNADVARILNE